MSSYCLLDRLPVELLHALFDYFITPEIFFTLFNLSNYVNSTVYSYPNHRLHCRSIGRSHFRLICQHLQPEQVVSLVLSDANDTAGLSKLFFTYFRMEQFIRLQSLTLIEIEHASLYSIFTDLHKLKNLRSFSFNNQTVRYENSLQTVSSNFRDDHIRSLCQLNRLHLSNSTLFTLSAFPHLQHLKVEECFGNEFQRILQHTPRLISLSVCMNLSGSKFNSLLGRSQLKELRLRIKSKF